MQLCDLCSAIYKKTLMVMISVRHINGKPVIQTHWCCLPDFLDGFRSFLLRVMYVGISKTVSDVVLRNLDRIF